MRLRWDRHPLSNVNFDPTGISETAIAASAASAAAAGGTAAAVGTTAGVAIGGISGAAAAAAATAATTFTAVGATAGIGLGTLSMGAAAAGGLVSAYGAYQQGQAQKNMMQYQAKAAAVQQDIVQKTAQANITGIENQSAMEAEMLGRKQTAQAGAQRAAIGAAMGGGSGTAADIAKDTFTKQQLDQMTLQYNANVNSWNVTNNANAQLWGLGAQEGQYSIGAGNAAVAGDIGAGGSLLGSAAQVGTIGVISNTQGNPGYF